MKQSPGEKTRTGTADRGSESWRRRYTVCLTVRDLPSFPGSSGGTAQMAEAQEAGRRHRQSVCHGGEEGSRGGSRQENDSLCSEAGKDDCNVALQIAEWRRHWSAGRRARGRTVPAASRQEANQRTGAGLSNSRASRGILSRCFQL